MGVESVRQARAALRQHPARIRCLNRVAGRAPQWTTFSILLWSSQNRTVRWAVSIDSLR
jgi:hypothetical protein